MDRSRPGKAKVVALIVGAPPGIVGLFLRRAFRPSKRTMRRRQEVPALLPCAKRHYQQNDFMLKA